MTLLYSEKVASKIAEKGSMVIISIVVIRKVVSIVVVSNLS